MKVYVEPIKYWKNGYNILDVIILIIITIPYILRKAEGNHFAYLHFADGIQSLRILKLISYSRGIRVGAPECGSARICTCYGKLSKK